MNPTEVSDEVAEGPAVTDSGAPEIFVPRRGARRRSVVELEAEPVPEPELEPTMAPEQGMTDVLAGASAIEELLRQRDESPVRSPFTLPRLEMPWVDPLARTPELTDELRDFFSQETPPPITAPVVTMPQLTDLPSGQLLVASGLSGPVIPTGDIPPPPPSMAPVMFRGELPDPSPALLANPPLMATAPAPTVSSAPLPTTTPPASVTAPVPTVGLGPAMGSASTVVPVPTPVVLTPVIPNPAAAQPAARAPIETRTTAPTRAARQLKRRRRRRRFVMAVSWIVVLAVVVAGAVVARNMLLEPSWDPDAEVFAEAVELANGGSFTKSVTITEVSGPAFSTRVYDVLVGTEVAGQRVAAARAMGLLQGAYDSMSSAQIVADGRLAVFDPVTNSVVVSGTAPDDPVRDAAIAGEMDVALASQTTGWADGWTTLPTAERIARRGFVDGNAVLVGDGWSSASGRVSARPSDVLPPVEIPLDSVPMGVPDDVLLAGLLHRSAGAWAVTTLDDQLVDEARRAVLLRNDGFLWDPRAAVDGREVVAAEGADMRGMGYWFLVLASRLDAGQAWEAARSWSSDRQELTTRSGQTCVNSTISTRDEVGLFTLASALNEWAEAAPPEAATTVQVTDAGEIVIQSCDPGASSTTRSRTTGPAELVSYAVASWHVSLTAKLAAMDAGNSDPASVTACAITTASDQGVVAEVARALRAAPEGYAASALSDTVTAAAVGSVVDACLGSS